MTTARDVCRYAFKQLLVTGVGEEPTAADAADSLYLLNQMMHDWRNDGVDVLHSDYALGDTFAFWVPPKDADGATIDAAAYQGTWDATANSPTLATSVGTNGHVYKVATAGSTTLNAVTSWAVGDYLIFDGWSQAWLKGRTSRQFEHGITAMLAVRMSSMFSVPPAGELVATADAGWRKLQAAYVVAPLVAVDDALRRMNSNRYINGNLL